jgi:TP901 family phage tail tape measure protein
VNVVLGGGFDLGTAYGKIILDASQVQAGMDQARTSIRSGLQGMGEGIQAVGAQVSAVGDAILKFAAPALAGFGAATASAMSFDEAMTNVGAVLGKSREEMTGMSADILEVGRNSRYGAQQSAEAFYDIVGGVADASNHMAIFNAAIHTAQAGNANLKGTTNALISVMNGYSFAADKAGFASNVLTQTVNKGVGTMDQFASALPDVAGLAHTAGIEFDDLGGMMAYITTKGTSASESSTQLTGAILSLLKPSEAMQGALSKIGFESGAAAIKQLGLAGTFKKLVDSGADITDIIPRIEGIRGAIALTDEGATSFLNNFSNGLDGVTASAEKIQMSSPAAQFALLKSNIQATVIQIGEALLPALNQIVQQVQPFITAVGDWVSKNPELIAQIAQIVAVVAGLGAGLSIVGRLIWAAGSIIAVLGGPLTLIIGIIAALFLAFKTNFLGIRDLLEPIVKQVVDGLQTLFGVLGHFGEIVQEQGIGAALGYVANAFMQMLGLVANDDLANGAMDIGNGIVNAFLTVVQFIQSYVLPVLTTLGNWFLNDALPAVINFIQTAVVPAIQSFIGFLSDLWTIVGPHLQNLANWFIQDALPAVLGFISGTVIPAIGDFIRTLTNIWNFVSPFLLQLVDWFLNTGLPFIQQAVQWFLDNVWNPAVTALGQLWVIIQPVLQQLYDWFVTVGLPFINDALTWFKDNILQPVIDLLTGIWNVVSPVLQSLFDWFITKGLPLINTALNDFMTKYVQPVIDLLSGIWTAAQPGIDALKTNLETAFNWIKDHIIQPIIDKIEEFKKTLSDIGAGLSAWSGAGSNAQTAMGMVQSGQVSNNDFLGAAFNAIKAEFAPRDSGGAGYAGMPYLIGSGAQPELFVPQTNGTFVPNADQMMGGGDTIHIYVTANDAAGGRAAGNAAADAIIERRRSRGS